MRTQSYLRSFRVNYSDLSFLVRLNAKTVKSVHYAHYFKAALTGSCRTLISGREKMVIEMIS